MGSLDDETVRTAPQRTLTKWKAWRMWASYWNWTYIIMGALLSTVTTVVAANTKKNFLGDKWSLVIACSAAVLSFVVNALGAQSKSAAFETAGRELEKAIATFELDSTIPPKALADAENRGVDILNRLKPQ
jgi:hypothetical protein